MARIIENGEQSRAADPVLAIKKLMVPRFLPWLCDATLDWVVIAAAVAFALNVRNPLAYFASLVVIGNRQHALAILGHEGAHYTLASNRRWNDGLANLLFFWPVLLTVEGYRRLHFIHHNHTGSSKDPELLHKKARAPQWDLPLEKPKLALFALKDLIGYSIPDLLIILTFSKPEKKFALLPILALHAAFLAATIGFGTYQVALLWYCSLATTFMMFFRLRLWVEHQGTFGTQRVTLNKLTAAVIAPHKIWLHWEHHRYPTLPYHRLEEARDLLPGPKPLALKELIAALSKSERMPSGASRDAEEATEAQPPLVQQA